MIFIYFIIFIHFSTSTPTDRLVWAAQAHLGGIIYAGNSLQAENVQIIITACTSGMIKSWIVHHTGKLILFAHLNTSSVISSFSCTSLSNANRYFIDEDDNNNENENKNEIKNSNRKIIADGESSIQDQYSNEKKGKYIFFQKAEKHRFLCLCGDFQGNLETWILSNNTEISLKINQQHPIFRKQISSYPTNKISLVGEYNSNLILNFQNSNNCQFFNIFTIHGDGMIISLQIKENGTFQYDLISPFLTVPYFPRNITQLVQKNVSNILIISDNEIIKLKSFDNNNNINYNNHIYHKKTVKSLNYINYDNDDDDNVDSIHSGRDSKQGSVLGNDDDDGNSNTYDDTISVWENNEHFPDNGSIKSENDVLPLSEFEFKLKLKSNLESTLKNKIPFLLDQILIDDNYLLQIKKDRNLLELYRQIDIKNIGVIACKNVALLICTWLKINIEKLEESSPFIITNILSNLLDLNYENYSMKFTDIIKVASIVSLEYKKHQIPKIRNKLEYLLLKSNVRTVTYNSIGEKVIQKKLKQSLNVFSPSSTVNENLLNNTFSSMNLDISQIQKPSEVPFLFLKKIPSRMQPYLKDSNWVLDNRYKLDFRRTVRICRTIIEMRLIKHPNENLIFDLSEINGRIPKNFNKLRNKINNNNNNNNYDNNNYDNNNNNLNNGELEEEDAFYNHDIPKLILLYFIRNHGSSSLVVSQQRIFHFLESIVKYSKDHPIIEFFHILLFNYDINNQVIDNYDKNSNNSSKYKDDFDCDNDDNNNINNNDNNKNDNKNNNNDIIQSNYKLSLAIYINSWGFLHSRGYVISGDLVPRDCRTKNQTQKEFQTDLGPVSTNSKIEVSSSDIPAGPRALLIPR